MSFFNRILKEDILKLQVVNFDGKIILIDDLDKFNKNIPNLYKEKIWGFDTETKPSFKKGESNQNTVSLLQLSSKNITFLFRLNKIGFPDELLEFLSNHEYLKVGLSIKDDLNLLRKLKNFSHKGFIDLQTIVHEYGIEDMGLRKLAAIVLQRRVSKSQQLTNWDAEELTEKQQIYAATDSWVCREIYLKLISSQKNR